MLRGAKNILGRRKSMCKNQDMGRCELEDMKKRQYDSEESTFSEKLVTNVEWRMTRFIWIPHMLWNHLHSPVEDMSHQGQGFVTFSTIVASVHERLLSTFGIPSTFNKSENTRPTLDLGKRFHSPSRSWRTGKNFHLSSEVISFPYLSCTDLFGRPTCHSDFPKI